MAHWAFRFPGLLLLVLAMLALARSSAAAGEKLDPHGKLVDGVINLNTAPPGLLLLLPGVGPGRVRGILAYRARRPFRTVDELVRIKGIGRRMVRDIRPHLAVTGPSTAHAGPAGIAAAAPVVAPPPGPPASQLRPSCRPNPALPVRVPGAKPRLRAMRAAANHCAPPA